MLILLCVYQWAAVFGPLEPVGANLEELRKLDKNFDFLKVPFASPPPVPFFTVFCTMGHRLIAAQLFILSPNIILLSSIHDRA